MDEIKIKKKYVWIFVGVFSILAIGLLVYPKAEFTLRESGPSVLELKQQYSLIPEFDKKGSCGALNRASDEDFLKGSCCGTMREERYVKQRSYLNKYVKIDDVPKDPWNVPASLARELTEYGKSVSLSENELKVYEEAFEIFDEGPCCCKCWRWFTFDGLAKKMIKEEGFSAQQVAELWAAEDVCGDEDPFEEIGDND